MLWSCSFITKCSLAEERHSGINCPTLLSLRSEPGRSEIPGWRSTGSLDVRLQVVLARKRSSICLACACSSWTLETIQLHSPPQSAPAYLLKPLEAFHNSSNFLPPLHFAHVPISASTSCSSRGQNTVSYLASALGALCLIPSAFIDRGIKYASSVSQRRNIRS